MLALLYATLTFIICMRTVPQIFDAKRRALASLSISVITIALLGICRWSIGCVPPDPISIAYSYKANAYLASLAPFDLKRIVSTEFAISCSVLAAWILYRKTLLRLLHCDSDEVDQLIAKLGAYVSMTLFSLHIVLIVSGL